MREHSKLMKLYDYFGYIEENRTTKNYFDDKKLVYIINGYR
jgi:hypothetical protein